ncbi:hypothetical protein CHU32_00790 [Superficieibacter electus]|uniref:Uncharacterized protein n=1 Tax=Superficieibacter electus TaxID=2022662 RepID=A0A2P5GVY8_9ENTR|nr:hypothetical protein [Superficieibacter electus]POP47715.1 hypothetical protein CHU33_00790 [Superficieibacter electus]POP50726.1 hypothetical protein CHU32_00790 [Superficieibacter electus]
MAKTAVVGGIAKLFPLTPALSPSGRERKPLALAPEYMTAISTLWDIATTFPGLSPLPQGEG